METDPHVGFAPNQECPWSMGYKDEQIPDHADEGFWLQQKGTACGSWAWGGKLSTFPKMKNVTGRGD